MPLLQKLNMVPYRYARGHSIVTNQNKSVACESFKQKKVLVYLKTCWCQNYPFHFTFLVRYRDDIQRILSRKKMSSLVPGYVMSSKKVKWIEQHPW